MSCPRILWSGHREGCRTPTSRSGPRKSRRRSTRGTGFQKDVAPETAPSVSSGQRHPSGVHGVGVTVSSVDDGPASSFCQGHDVCVGEKYGGAAGSVSHV